VRGGSNPGPKRSGPADGTLPVEVYLHSWGRGRAQSGAEVVRSGSYPVSRIVPKKLGKTPPPGGLVRAPTEPHDALYKDLVPLVPKCVLHTSRVASPAEVKPVRGSLNQGPRRDQDRFTALFSLSGFTWWASLTSTPCSLCHPQLHPPKSTQSLGVLERVGEALGLQRRVRALACLKSTAVRTDNDNTAYAEPLHVGLNYSSYTYI
jgi:hypothetical protein